MIPPRLTAAQLAQNQRLVESRVSVLRGILAVSYVCTVAAVLTTVLRIYGRFYLAKRVGVDDILMAVATVFILSQTPLVQIILNYWIWLMRTMLLGGRIDMTALMTRTGYALKIQWINTSLYGLIIGILKLSILAYYRRFMPRQPYDRYIFAAAAVIGCFAVATTLASFFQCIPVWRAWRPTGVACSVDVLLLNALISIFGLVTDLVVLLLPVPVVLRLRMDLKRRLGLVLVFSIGAVGTAVTALRLWKNILLWRLAGDFSDRGGRRTVEMSQLVLLSHIELGVIAACANMPTLAGWWRTRPSTTRATGSGSGSRSRTRITGPHRTGGGPSLGASSSSGTRSGGGGSQGTVLSSTTTTDGATTGGQGGGGGGGGKRDRFSLAVASCAIRMESLTAAAARRMRPGGKGAGAAADGGEKGTLSTATGGGKTQGAGKERRASAAGFSKLASAGASPAATVTDDDDGGDKPYGHYVRTNVAAVAAADRDDDDYEQHHVVGRVSSSLATGSAAKGGHGASSVEELVPERLV